MKSLVIGIGGLLGSAVSAQLVSAQFTHPVQHRIRWSVPDDARADLQLLLDEFRRFVAKDSWTIFWCAGKGHLRSLSAEVNDEVELFDWVLKLLKAWPNRNGVLTMCSSAGALWYSTSVGVITEQSPDTGKSPYALAKSVQEDLLRSACLDGGIRGVAARISTVYGANQDLTKSQGLISRLCHSATAQQQLDIFVPLETTRNYIFAPDAAKMMTRLSLFMLNSAPPSTFTKKIICSRESQSIASLCNSVELVSRKKPQISSRITPESSNYPLHFKLRSITTPDTSSFESATILSGISAVYHHILGQQQLGNLARTVNAV